MNTTAEPCRVLVVDDNLSIHHDFERILGPRPGGDSFDLEIEELLGASAGGGEKPDHAAAEFDLAFAAQGAEALGQVQEAKRANRPFALAFVDMRMPPGWDGLMTIEKVWAADPAVHVVICTAHSDRSWDEIASRLAHQRDHWSVLKKPFDKIEVLQLARVMTEKWRLVQQAQLSKVS